MIPKVSISTKMRKKERKRKNNKRKEIGGILHHYQIN